MKPCIVTAICLTILITATGCCTTHVDSPNGDVPFGEEACSPDGRMYAREIEPRNQGRLGLYDKGTGRLLKEVQVNYHPGRYPNSLKGLAWSPDGKRLAVMYHYDGRGHISLVNVDTGEEVKSIPISKYYHSMKFSSEKVIDAGGDTLRVE
jgi:WD40 repeat protein